MDLAVNYSEVLLKILKNDSDLPIDFIKVPTQPFPECWGQFKVGQQYRRLLPHIAQPGVLALGHPLSEMRSNLVTLREIIAKTEPPYLSTHLEVKVEFFPQFRTMQHGGFLSKFRDVLLAHFSRAISEITAQIQTDIAIENFPYYRWWQHYRIGSEPEFISEVCRASDCGFVLDIAHARCSSWHMGQNIYDYLGGLPLERLCEIHISGSTERKGEGIRDTHTKLLEDDYRLLEWVLKRSKPDILTIEYGGLPDQIMNLQQVLEPIHRNDEKELLKIIRRITRLIGVWQ